MNPGKCIISTQVPQAVYDQIKAAAAGTDHTLSHYVATLLTQAAAGSVRTVEDINRALIEISDKVQAWIDKYGYDELRNMYGNPSNSMSISNLVTKLECISDAEYKRAWDDRQHLHGLFGADKEVRKKL